jgi:hypothetical protein
MRRVAAADFEWDLNSLESFACTYFGVWSCIREPYLCSAGTVLVNALRGDIVKFHQLSGGSIEAIGMLFSECKNMFLFA